MTSSTRLTTAQYRELWMQDLERFVLAQTGNDASAVPTCPEWSVADLADHLAGVYEHKILLLETGKFPSRVHTAAFHEARRSDPDRLHHAATELVAALSAHADHDPAPTFMAEDQTIGFWWRRMALETAVHRTDAEMASGSRTPVDAALAVDGIDELLWFATAPWSTVGDRSTWVGQRILVDAGVTTWMVTLDTEGIEVDHGGGACDAAIAGAPDALLQWAAGRWEDGLVRSGDGAALELLEAHLRGF
jgi:uncharacterized protein (TIGR03083 family)